MESGEGGEAGSRKGVMVQIVALGAFFFFCDRCRTEIINIFWLVFSLIFFTIPIKSAAVVAAAAAAAAGVASPEK